MTDKSWMMKALEAEIAKNGGPTVEPITINEALHAIRSHAKDYLPPAVASLLNRLVILEIARLLPASLVIYLCDVGRELRERASAQEEGSQPSSR